MTGEGFSTRFTERFGVRLPIVLAPMAGWTHGPMAAAVSACGGLGSFGASDPGQPDRWVAEQIEAIRSATTEPFAVGFNTHSLDRVAARFDITVETEPPAVILSFSNPQPWLDRAHDAGCKVICQVQTVEQAVSARDEGADALVAQGTEAGGHTGQMGLFPLLASVLRRCPDIPVLTAGGVGDAASLAAVMALGADGALLGTAFLASEEAPALHPRAKKVIVDSDGGTTVWTRAYDIAMGLSFPEGIGARVHANAFTRRWEGREQMLAEQRDAVAGHLRAFDSEPDDEAWLMYGQSAAFIDAVRPIAEIMRKFESGLESTRQL
jgi:nitronate monooxygenase